nr:Chain B, Mismatch repair endonuclease PMS2 [Homo sapiens]
TPNTKRFKKEE